MTGSQFCRMLLAKDQLVSALEPVAKLRGNSAGVRLLQAVQLSPNIE